MIFSTSMRRGNKAIKTNFPSLILKLRMSLSFPLIHSKTGVFGTHFGLFTKCSPLVRKIYQLCEYGCPF